MSVRVRFAVTLGGGLTLSAARTALYNWLFARKRGGQFLLRFDDLHPAHVTPGAEAAVLDDLRWLGLDWDEEPFRQSGRADRYRGAAEQLMDREEAYRCFCAPEQLEHRRRQLVAGGVSPRYDGRCRTLTRDGAARRYAAGEPATVRFVMPARPLVALDLLKGAVDGSTGDSGDFVILHADGSPASSLATVVDDAAMRVTHVIRGEEHIGNTPRQIALARALGLPSPAFAHLPPIQRADGSPLGKRHAAPAVAEYRQAGVLGEALANFLALLGWSPPVGHSDAMSLGALVRLFGLDRVSREPARFSAERLAGLNRRHLRRATPERLAALVGMQGDGPVLRLLDVARREASTLTAVLSTVSRALRPAPVFLDPGARGILEAVRAGLPNAFASEAGAAAAVEAAMANSRGSRRGLLQAVRTALIGEAQGPPVAALLWALGADESRRRLERALGALTGVS